MCAVWENDSSDQRMPAEVRAACERTVGFGAARVIYEMQLESRLAARLIDLVAEADVTPEPSKPARTAWSLVGRGLKAAEKGVGEWASGRSEGVADFGLGACVLRRRMLLVETETLYLPGRILERHRGGRWRQKSTQPFVGSAVYSPIWLIDLLRGTTAAALVGQDMVGEMPCRHIRGTADRREASRLSEHGISTQIGRRRADWPADFEAWIDAAGVLRRIRCEPKMHDPDMSEVVAAGTFDVTLADLGLGQSPELPAEGEIAAGELWVPKCAEAIVRSWTTRLPAVLPHGIALDCDNGLTFTLTALTPSRRRSVVQLEMMSLRLSGEAPQKMQRAYRTHAEALQQLLSELTEADWPGPDPVTRVEVKDSRICVTWWE